jgi:photosystem II stability/assembly factor-like uncharacterized protein
MKQLLFFLFLLSILFSCTTGGNPTPPPDPNPADTLNGWQRLALAPASPIADLAFVNPKDGFLCSASGFFRTLDSGRTWGQIPLNGPAFNLVTVNFRDALYGYATGLGIFAFTTNGGTTWTTRTAGVPAGVDVQFVSPSTGLVGGNEGVFRTTDTGATWVRVLNEPIFSLSFVGNTGWALRANTNALFRTTDGGLTWALVPNMPPNTSGQTVFFLDAQRGWIAGGSGVLRTVDGGQTWQSSTVPGAVFDVQFLDAQRGYVTAGDAVYRTANGGVTWIRDVRLSSHTFLELFFLDAAHGWTAGTGPSLLRWKQ